MSEDIKAWRETFEIMSNKALMLHPKKAEAARREGKKSDFIPWEKAR
jgi:hypothetical protein